MKSTIAVCVILACAAMAYAGCLPNKFPYSRDNCPRDTKYDYAVRPDDYVNYYQHNYLRPVSFEGSYFGYPYGECSSCRRYTKLVGVERPVCHTCHTGCHGGCGRPGCGHHGVPTGVRPVVL